MKTSTLQHLIDSFADVRHYHLAAALLETDPARQSRERHKAHRVGAILDAIQFELAAREAGDGRPTDEARRADSYLQRLLEEFLDLGELDRKRDPANVSPDPSDTMLRAGIVAAPTSSPNAKRN